MMRNEAIRELLSGYAGNEVPTDEIWADNQIVFKQWESLFKRLKTLGIDEIESRSQEIQKTLFENGVSYNQYNLQGGAQRPWQLDPIPYLINQDRWDYLESGLRQRLEVLNCLFKDIYGPKKLLKEGILPPQLIYSDRQFLRPCDHLPLLRKNAIQHYAADISRSPDGQIWVIGDRTQAPSGWAYTMENRVTLARVIPELFVKSGVKKIAAFYQRYRQNLMEAAPKSKTNPMIAILSPGPYNATYYEHAYLAASGGFQLVQGQDLMVKDNFLWMKTLSGLQKVDVLVRHVDDTYCDPLSLRPDSQLGVAGLLQVARQGNVAIANPLGSGVLENPALMAFMPSLCKYFLGEDLLLPNIASWWCGQRKERQYVLEHIDQLVIKDVKRSSQRRTLFGWELSEQEKQSLIQKIQRHPHRFVGQEQAVFSTAPAWKGDALEPRRTVLRCFATAATNDYHFLPGGLTRSAPTAGNSHVSNQSGGIGKDTWVLSDAKASSIQIDTSGPRISASAKGIEGLTSRSAENLFWVGRYLMRSKLSARFLRTILKCQVEIENFEDSVDENVLPILLESITHLTMTYPGFVGEEGAASRANPEQELLDLLTNQSRVGSLAHSIASFKNSANATRNSWSSDTWRIVDQMDANYKRFCSNDKIDKRKSRKALDELIRDIAAIQGFTMDSLSIQEGRPVFDLGINLEKALSLCSLLRSTLVVQQKVKWEEALIEYLLKTLESLSSYRQKYKGGLSVDSLVEMILLDDTYPQSLAWMTNAIQNNQQELPNPTDSYGLREDQKEMIRVNSQLKLSELKELMELEEDSNYRAALDEFFGHIYGNLAAAANSTIQTYFNHTEVEVQKSTFPFELDF